MVHRVRLGQGAGLGPTSVHTPASPDVDECVEQSDECRYNQICENTPGGHRCSCPRGYRLQGPGLPCLGTGHSAPWWKLVGSEPSGARAGSVSDKGVVS